MTRPTKYDNIDGIFTLNDKHVDATLSDYNGNAKPGQVVVDSSDYSLYVADANGNLSPVGGGGSGSIGATGAAGIQGNIGATGLTGLMGNVGATGVTGNIGATGLTGPAGTNGTSVTIIGTVDTVGANPQITLSAAFPNAISGNGVVDETSGNLWTFGGTTWADVGQIKGDDGATGLTGNQGATGIGFNGATGAAGTDGAVGDTGLTGNQGATGIGFNGATGAAGTDGAVGTTGLTGNQGIQGIQGAKGDTGDTGPQGIQGIQGAKGDTGDTGPQGIQGIQGAKGDTGEVGATGLSGATGAAGTNGSVGATGVTGADGIYMGELPPADTSILWLDTSDQTGVGVYGIPAGGTTNQVIVKSSGTDYDVNWEDQSGGGGGSLKSISTVTSSTALGSAASTDYYYFVNSELSTTQTLPTAVGNTNTYVIKNLSTTGIVTIATTLSQTIDGGASYMISNQNHSITLISDGTNWRII